MDARKSTIEKNIGLVHACAKRFKERGLEYDDIFQSGCIGLMKAVDSFDKERGVQFSTYAVPVILGEIKQLFRNSGSIKVSRRLKELSLRARRQCESFIANKGRKPTVNELAELLEVDVQQAIESLEATKAPISLTCNDDDGEYEMDIPVEFEDEKISSEISLNEALRTLDESDRNLIRMRFFKGATQSQTARVLGMTQVKVSRREKALLKMLRLKLV